jgi:hypothetical protein
VKGTYLVPFLLLLVYLGGFAVKNSFGDMVIVLLFGALGWFMIRFDWQRPPLLLGLVLGGIAENNLFISTKIYGAGFLARPGVIIITLMAVGALSYPIFKARMEKRKKSQATPVAAPGVAHEVVEEVSTGSRLTHGLFALFFVAMFAYVLREVFFGFGLEDERAALFPMIIAVPSLALALVALGNEILSTHRVTSGAESWEEAAVEPAVARQRLISIISWTLGFFLAIWLLGFTISSVAATFLYLKFGANENWGISIILTVVAWAFFFGLFDYTLHLPFPDGDLFVWLGY